MVATPGCCAPGGPHGTRDVSAYLLTCLPEPGTVATANLSPPLPRRVQPSGSPSVYTTCQMPAPGGVWLPPGCPRSPHTRVSLERLLFATQHPLSTQAAPQLECATESTPLRYQWPGDPRCPQGSHPAGRGGVFSPKELPFRVVSRID